MSVGSLKCHLASESPQFFMSLRHLAGFTIALAAFCTGCQQTSSRLLNAATPDAEPQSPPVRSQAVDCTNATTTLEINECVAESYRQADAELNRVYNELIAQLNGENREKLVTAQLAWIEFRDANCEWEAFRFEGGTIQPSMRLGCLERLTRDRTLALQNYASNLY